MSSLVYFEALFFFFRIRIKELNFWWDFFLRKLNTTSNDGMLNPIYLAVVLKTTILDSIHVENGNWRASEASETLLSVENGKLR